MVTLSEGTAIGQYLIVKKIGEGGMGAVYLAHHALLGRPAAIKLLLPALSSQPEVIERFFNEARATTSVPDPGIVQVYDFGVHSDGSAYIVMELLDGESLEKRIQRNAIAVVDALRITRQLAGSLAAAHARGIVHRDLKPENVMLVRDAEAQGGERAKILDFGIAKLTGGAPDRSRTRTGTLLGTPVYMSPEQCRGSGAIDHRTDIYSLGCVLFHMLCGRPPFDLEGMGEIISAHLREPPRPPSTFASGVGAAIDELVLRCLAKDPADRFQSMTELHAACDGQLARISGAGAATIAAPFAMPATVIAPGPVTTLSRAAGQAAVTTPPRRSARLALVASTILALIALGVGALLFVRASRHDDDVREEAATPVARPVTPVDAGADAPPGPAIEAARDAAVDAAVATEAPDARVATPPSPRPHRTTPSHRPSRPVEDPYDTR